MSDVNYLILKKDTSIFGKIVGKNIHLLDNNKSFKQINTKDEFLKETTKSYQISKGGI